MIPHRPSLMQRLSPIMLLLPVFLTVAGCSSGKQAQLDELSAANSRMRFEMDSLMSANRRLGQQVEALASENRVLTARTADLEVRLREGATPPPPSTPPPMNTDPGSAYADALGKYQNLDFQGAMAGFNALLKNGVRDDLADNCHYWIGECLYGMGNYGEAIGHFENALGYENSEKKDDSMLMIANAHAAMGNMGGAKEWYNKIISSYPASPYVKRAREKLSALGG